MRGLPAEGRDDDKPATDGPPADATPAARRVRAVTAGHVGDEPEARRATGDHDPTVRAAGWSALARLGCWDAATAATATLDDDPGVRRRAAELTGLWAHCDPGGTAGQRAAAISVLVALLADTDDGVVEMSAWALGEVVPGADDHVVRSTVAALVGTARAHRDPLCREAAVAALGAIGHPDGLEAVLDALDGKPPLRRRAAVALAAFDDPRADTALTRCLQDRDWQVREVAEELLRPVGTRSPRSP